MHFGADSATSSRHSYAYDGAYRLTAATHPAQPGETYVYDEAGNRVGSSDGTFFYNAADQLLRRDGASYQYSPNGNLTVRRCLFSRNGPGARRSRSASLAVWRCEYDALSKDQMGSP